MDALEFATLTRTALNERADEALVIVPIGATEQHGPHLPVGTDFLVAGEVARRAAAALAARVPVLLAPVLPFGHSPHHLPFGGTISVTQETYRRLLVEIGASLAASGFRKVFFLNGHGGNVELSMLAARELGLAHGVAAAAGSYWMLAWERLVALDAHASGRFPGHAGAFETSLALALWPHLVAAERPARDLAPPPPAPASSFGAYSAAYPGEWEATDGYSDSPAAASAAAGTRYLEAIVAAVAEHVEGFWRRAAAGAADL